MKKHLSTIALVLTLFLGVGILLYPFVSDIVNAHNQSRVVETYEEAVQGMTPQERNALHAAAEEFNSMIAQRETHFSLSEEERTRYQELLSTPNGVMATISIDRIKVTLPIYHGTEDALLQVGIGHLEGSSLPIGGASTHSVLVGHRGLPTSTLFTRLDELHEGDTFMVGVLDEELWYEIDQIRIVEPHDISALAVEQGKDYCTLLTCTPYGINTHRLLVRGHRIDHPSNTDVGADAVQIDNMTVLALAVVPLLIAWGVWAAVRAAFKRQQGRSKYKGDASL